MSSKLVENERNKVIFKQVITLPMIISQVITLPMISSQVITRTMLNSQIITRPMISSQVKFWTMHDELTVIQVINNHRVSIAGKMFTFKTMIIIAEKINLFVITFSVSNKMCILRTFITLIGISNSLKIHNNLIVVNFCTS